MRLPKLLGSEWSYAQYRLPAQPPSSNLAALGTQAMDPTAERVEEERCTVAWIKVPVDDPPAPLPAPSAQPSRAIKPTSKSPATEYQLVALTYSGGWYRLSLPPVAGSTSQPESRPGTPSGGRASGSVLSSSPNDVSVLSGATGRGRGGEGAAKEGKEGKEKQSHQCVLEEFRRFGRWDGWG